MRRLELEQLMNIEVTTGSRTESTVGQSPAAVYVITQEDIRRSGASVWGANAVNFPLGDRQKFVYGFGYRLIDSFFSKSGVDNGFIFFWNRPQRDTQLFSGFVQDQIAVIKNRFSVLFGTKIEHNDFTGFELQPT